MAVKILLADDDKVMRDGLRSLIEKQPEMEVVAEAENGRTAVRLNRKLRPDVIVMDIHMPEVNGIEATRRIVEEFPRLLLFRCMPTVSLWWERLQQVYRAIC
jgi:DNA-binding NarL/FixJ family response regulator